MRIRISKNCGKEFKSEKERYLCSDCAEKIRKNSTIRDRICRNCGATFSGGPRAWYCPKCREERKKLQNKKFKQTGAKRKLGSVDICQKCGREYIVNGGKQLYCPDCAENAVKEKIRPQKRIYTANYRKKNLEKIKNNRSTVLVCVVCGKHFNKNSARNTCSPECERKRNLLNYKKADFKRGQRLSSQWEQYESGLPKSGIVGITFHKTSGKWRVTYKGKYIGIFKTIEEAEEALKEAVELSQKPLKPNGSS